jgi:hypothetical protein
MRFPYGTGGPPRMRRVGRPPRMAAALAASALVAAGTVWAVGGWPAGSADAESSLVFDVPEGVGASVPFVEYEAEGPNATTNGTVVGPDYTQGTLASEATGRKAVRLSAVGQYVEFTLTAPANAVNVRYNVPKGASGSLSVYVNWKLVGRLALTAKYSYLDTPNIGGSKTHHLFDDARTILGGRADRGDKVRLQVDPGDGGAAPYTIDVADFEDVAGPLAPPEGSVSVVDAGADATGAADATAAFNKAIADASGKGKQVWIPPGTFLINGPLTIDKVTVRGAGPWHSVLRGSRIIDNQTSTGPIKLYDFAVFGEVTTRNDSSPDNFVNGSLGNGSVVSNIWMQHLKVGMWLMGPNNTNLTIENNRILDMTADAINLNGAVKNSVVKNTFVRNTGDDGLAMWSLREANKNNTFSNNTVVQPNLANGIAIYGGTDITLSRNVVADTNALGSGIAISNQQFIAGQGFTPLAGKIALTDNVLLRTGAMNPNWNHPMGAIRLDSYDYAIKDAEVTITGTHIIGSPYSAFEIVSGGGHGHPVTGVTVDGATIRGVGTVVLQVETQGNATFTDVVASGVARAGVYNCPYPNGSGTFTADLGSGNSGWGSTWKNCGTWPDPALPDNGAPPAATAPPSSPPAASPGRTASTSKPSAPPSSGPRSTRPAAPDATNLARGKPAFATSHTQEYRPDNALDGDPNSYWESANHAFPQVFTVDLGAVRAVDTVVVKLPPATIWGRRTQTLSIMGSVDGVDYTSVLGTRGFSFDPSTGNTASATFTPRPVRFLLVLFTANTGWPGAQLGELEAYPA